MKNEFNDVFDLLTLKEDATQEQLSDAITNSRWAIEELVIKVPYLISMVIDVDEGPPSMELLADILDGTSRLAKLNSVMVGLEMGNSSTEQPQQGPVSQ
ncbi:MAG: hypothetical protein ACH255_08915 [Candidatus Thiodiazotropha sp.]